MRPTARDVAGLFELWTTTAEQRLPGAGAIHPVWGDPLAAAGGAVSARLCRVAGGAVGSGIRDIAVPTHRGRSAVDGLSVGRVCAVGDGVSLASAVDRCVAGGGYDLDVGPAGGAAGHGAARSLSDLHSIIR